MARPLSVLCALALVASLGRPAHADDPSPDAVLEQRAPAIVSLKFILKADGNESQTEVLGTVIDPTGLVVLPNADLGGDGVKASDVKVLFGSDPKEWEAVIVARDKVLSLAYLQVLGLGEKGVPAIDFVAGPEPKLGLGLYGVSREGRGFDFAPSIQRCYVSSRVEKPRLMWGVSGDFATAGLPVFDMAGRAVGLLADQDSSEGAAQEGESTTTGTFLLPLADVTRSLAAAKKRVPEAVAKAEAAKKEPPPEAAPKAPEAPKAPDAPKAPETPKAPESPK